MIRADTARRLYWPTFVVVLLAGAYANLGRIRTPTLLEDEPAYTHAGWLYVHGRTGHSLARLPGTNADNFEHPPLAKYLFGLAQLLVGHESYVASRAVAGLCILLTAAVVARWLAGAGQRWGGLVAAALILLLPQSVAPQGTRFAGDAFLDNVAVLPVVLGVALAYRWAVSERSRRDWLWAAAVGATVGLAIACKENAFLAILGPAIVLVIRGEGLRGRLERAGQLAAAAAVAVVVFVASYLPIGNPFPRIHFLYDYQSDHSLRGHPVVVAGHLYDHPPWWANLWFADHAMGTRVAVPLLVLAVVGVALAFRTLLVQWALAALVGPVVFHCFIAGVALPFYWVLWMPLFCVLPAVGVAELARRTRAGLVVAGLACAALAVVAVQVVVTLATLPAIGGAAAPRYVGGRQARVALIAARPSLLTPYFAHRVLIRLPADPSVLAGVVVGGNYCDSLMDPGLLALLHAGQVDGSLRLVHRDRMFRVYRALRPLTRPSPAAIAVQPDVPVRHC